MNTLASLPHDLKTDFWNTLARLQAGRGLWLLLAGTALVLELFSWSFFQVFLELKPCEMCVYIRFAMIAICLGGLIAAIRPSAILFRLIGYALCFWWTVQGFLWCLTLNEENIKAADPDWISTCGAIPSFPFGLPLDKWLPAHFKPLAACGSDSAWSLLGLSMPQWLFVVYGCFAALLLLMLFAWIKQAVSGKARQ